MTTTPTPPALPPGTPPLLDKAFAAALVIAGPTLGYLDPGGKITTGAAQALVILIFVLAGVILWSARDLIDAIRLHGFSKRALTDFDRSELAELHAVWPGLKADYVAAKPALAAIPALQVATTVLTSDVADVKSRLAGADLAPVESVLATAIAPAPIVVNIHGTAPADFTVPAVVVEPAADVEPIVEPAVVAPIPVVPPTIDVAPVVAPVLEVSAATPVTVAAPAGADGTVTSP